MKNITITLDEETARRARVRAAERDMSVSRYIGELVRKDIRASDEYQEAMQRYLSRGPFKELTGPPQRYATREELHEREHRRNENAARGISAEPPAGPDDPETTI